ncbi:MAG TPA: PEP-CTERM sorting domain-containing protein [Pyrinomonadaceae bacterium]|jgi:PEP-CTERM putative exosortase interaction domain|nr:PEP-CTERM sorting domain-containing protein [Pyrinomonadaceae bacterium]
MVTYKYLALVTLLGLFLFTGSEAKADSLTFSNLVALQNNGVDKIDLFTHPGIVLIGPQISFFVDIKGDLTPGVNTLLVTYQEIGSAPIVQSFQIPAFGVVPPPYTQSFTITSPKASIIGVGATLTLDILNASQDFEIPSGPQAGQRVDSYTYSFNVVQPVPEPATLVLFGSALSGCATILRRRRSKTT